MLHTPQIQKGNKMKPIPDQKAFEIHCYKKHMPIYRNAQDTAYGNALTQFVWEIWQLACTHKDIQYAPTVKKPHGSKGKPLSPTHKAKIAKGMQGKKNAASIPQWVTDSISPSIKQLQKSLTAPTIEKTELEKWED